MKRIRIKKVPPMLVILLFFITAIVIDKAIYPSKMKQEKPQVAKQVKDLPKVPKDTNSSYSK